MTGVAQRSLTTLGDRSPPSDDRWRQRRANRRPNAARPTRIPLDCRSDSDDSSRDDSAVMTLRRYIRLLVIAWLACQVAALSAFAPASCCPAHERTVDAATECESGVCPMHSSPDAQVATAPECPMHASNGAPSTPCVMRGLCNGPAVALSMLLFVPGVLTPTTALVGAHVSSPMASSTASLQVSILSHDTPPPRL